MDLIFFGGQSNMEGQISDSLPADTGAIESAVEYKFKTNEFVPLRHPAGRTFLPGSGEQTTATDRFFRISAVAIAVFIR